MSNQNTSQAPSSQQEITSYTKLPSSDLHKPLHPPKISLDGLNLDDTFTYCVTRYLSIALEDVLKFPRAERSRKSFAKEIGCSLHYVSRITVYLDQHHTGILNIRRRRAQEKTNILSLGPLFRNYKFFKAMQQQFPILEQFYFFDIEGTLQRFHDDCKEYYKSFSSPGILDYLNSAHVNKTSLYYYFLKAKKSYKSYKEQQRRQNLKRYGHEFSFSQKRG